MTVSIKRIELQDGDIVYIHGHRGVVSNLHLTAGHIIAGKPAHDEGLDFNCTQRYNVTSDPDEDLNRKLPGGYNGGVYGGCIINDPKITIAMPKKTYHVGCGVIEHKSLGVCGEGDLCGECYEKACKFAVSLGHKEPTGAEADATGYFNPALEYLEDVMGYELIDHTGKKYE